MEKNEYKPTASKSTKRTGRPKKAKGLGDTIEQITEATGVKAVVDWFSDATGIDCGCDKRKEALNALFSYEVECLNQDEYEFIGTLLGASYITREQQRTINTILERTTRRRYKVSNCGSCVRDRVEKLIKMHEAYADSAPQE
jgi:hypothetical protein